MLRVPRQPNRGCYLECAAAPAAPAARAFTLGSLGAERIDAQALASASSTALDAVEKRRATQDFQNTFPLHLAAVVPGPHQGELLERFLQLFPPTSWLTPPKQELQRIIPLPREKRRLKRVPKYAQRKLIQRFEELIARAQNVLALRAKVARKGSRSSRAATERLPHRGRTRGENGDLPRAQGLQPASARNLENAGPCWAMPHR